jgi:hypothetical protein
MDDGDATMDTGVSRLRSLGYASLLNHAKTQASVVAIVRQSLAEHPEWDATITFTHDSLDIECATQYESAVNACVQQRILERAEWKNRQFAQHYQHYAVDCQKVLK